MAKKFTKCKVCQDIHYGEAGPEDCPTCHAKNAFEDITPQEAKERLNL